MKKVRNYLSTRFNNLEFGYRQRTYLETGLKDAIEKLKKADHIVWVFPLWWEGYPVIMKGFINRTFLPGITYGFIEGKSTLIGLLKGKTVRVIIIIDTPKWYDVLVMKRPALKQFKKGTLEYCGISPVKVTYIAPIVSSSLETRKKCFSKIFKLGENLK